MTASKPESEAGRHGLVEYIRPGGARSVRQYRADPSVDDFS